MKERIEVTRDLVGAEAERRRPDRSEHVVAVRLHRRDMAPLVVMLGERALIVGRSEQADLRLHDKSVSRLHGLLRRDERHWSWVEFGTGNGSFVEIDDERIAIRAGNTITLDPATPIFLGSGHNRIEALTAIPRSEVDTATSSAAGRELEAKVASAATSRLSVLLWGPSGAGKTWAANQLHERSGRRGGFVSINCARLPTDVTQLHSELLGHVKGAYTGALNARIGSIFAAANGTLFLDEIDSASDVAQGFLLDVLEGRHPLLPFGMEPGSRHGSKQAPARPVVRFVIAAKTLHSKIRHDLHMRLMNGEVIEVPGLAERRDDIPALVEATRVGVEIDDVAARPVFSHEAMRALQEAKWPGEVRALRAAIVTLTDRAARSGVRIIDEAAVRTRLAEIAATMGPAPIADFPDDEATGSFRQPARTQLEQPATTTSMTAKPAPRHFSKEDLFAALAASGHNIDRTAQKLGWSRNTLTKKMDDFGIPRPGRS